MEEILLEIEDRMDKTITALKADMGRIRTGRANPSILDGIKVDAYGSLMELRQVASISVPEPRSLMISPWDKGNIDPICKAINKSELNLPPNSDGNVIRINIPELSEERRKDLVKDIKKRGEEAKIAIRNIRRDGNDLVKKKEKSKDLSEDEAKKGLGEIQKVTDEYVKKVDEVIAHKEKDVMEV